MYDGVVPRMNFWGIWHQYDSGPLVVLDVDEVEELNYVSFALPASNF